MVRSVRELDVTGKRVLVRVDFNVPLADGVVADDTRIRASLPTIQYLLERGARVIICSHLGRPKGQFRPELSMKVVADRLGELLDEPVSAAPDIVGPRVEQRVSDLGPGEVLVLENLRFHPGEETNDPDLVQGLARLCDLYVNDAFGTAHRQHASVVGVPGAVPGAAGLLLEKEVAVITGILSDPERPFVAVLGGAKVSDKIHVIWNLIPRVDTLILGGGMANTALAANDLEVGASLYEADQLEAVKSMLKSAADNETEVVLPVDVVVASEVSEAAVASVVNAHEVSQGLIIVDVGPVSRQRCAQIIVGARTVLWNGPMGVFEIDAFAEGTMAVARACAQCQGTTIIGGGDSIAAVHKAGVADRVSHVSTGGGATLKMLSGKELPGVAALRTEN